MGMNAAEIYRRQTVETGPEHLVTMLYDGAIQALERAAKAVAEKDMETSHRQLVKAQDILAQLIAGLDTSIPIGSDLAALYDYMLNRLIEANIKKDVAIIEEVRGFLFELKEVWVEAIKRSRETGMMPRSGSLNISG